MVSLNILDYSLVDEGSSPSQALHETAELAKLADQLGYKRFWVPEQHYAYSIASSTPEMLMMYLATVTKRIRIGSGGVMIPHYSPYKIAENFRMLEALHPHRIDLGIGNSPGGRLVQAALHEEKGETKLPYEQQVGDIIKYLTDDIDSEHRFQKLIATPAIESKPEVWMLGAGGRSTKIAAENGTSYIYAHFFHPSPTGKEVIQQYRQNFQPSIFQNNPNVGVAVFVIIGETEQEAESLAQAFFMWLVAIETAKNPMHFPSVETAKNYIFSSFEQQKVSQLRKRAIIGTPSNVKEELLQLAEYYHADELTIVPNFPGADKRMKGIELLAAAFQLGS
ncbi:LLM class flavin-dependent oxidoreductase [Caldibacillus lycopersici]|uniref:LLM class flavin-dependent oxidoreductase n=1 Tax=Perspicuibacillus lycopersici TaxID=1325689 RepID=A0AAE3IU73_9BACI|nr:LLM class flavin-dependent oxidoreductase [Perspicuibacillus lycopersici]MCU9614497.1 LLM class flavin-dependent oxidoreductase [Perspicuibacillus lycopersici]